MKLKFSKQTLLVIAVITIFLLFSFQSKFFEVAKQLEIYTTLFKELNMYYVDEINPAELIDKAIKNTLKDLDPYTNYYNEQDVEDAKIRREGEYGGIGVSVYYGKQGITIQEIYKGFSADKAGLKSGDIITKVNGQSLQNMEREEMSQFLKGIPNSSFLVTIKRGSKMLNLQLKRNKVVINPVPFFKMINAETGYIVLSRFNLKASSEVKKAYTALQEKGMKKLVFDLRGNPGGSLLEAIRISNFFLPKDKTIVSTKAKVKKWSNTYRSSNKPLDLKIPVVVLINGRSASASEIVSGALQDYDRAVIMGNRSFGKGLVQRYRKLTYGTQLKLTISKYYTPSGRCIQELDYTNRDKKGKVPKFSDSGRNKFTTQNGRVVYDGGGIEPDIKIETSKLTEETKRLLASRALFNFATDYYRKNATLTNGKNYIFSDADFNQFKKYLQLKDTTFTIKSAQLFKKAYKEAATNSISKEYNSLWQKLKNDKIRKISTNKDILKRELQEEIISRYYYREGVYEHKLTNDIVIAKAVALLNNPKKYQQILSN